MSKVAEAETVLAKAESDLKRIQPLAEKRAVSQSDLDAAKAIFEAVQSSLDAAEANLKAAKIKQRYTRIQSPIGGIIGKTMAKVGDFVGRSPNPVILNTVSNVDSVLVQFFITESEYLQLARYVERTNTAIKQDDRAEGLALILADGSLYKYRGKGDFINREVDPTTGAILMQASFPNPKQLLRPGQFARLRAKIAVVNGGILIPQRCVVELQGLYSVYVVDAEKTIQKRDIDTGPKVGQFWLITEGLAPGEKVVYEGLQTVSEGTVVNPVVHEVPLLDTANE
jgi:membrane fusion protein (multidrug efflux system)